MAEDGMLGEDEVFSGQRRTRTGRILESIEWSDGDDFLHTLEPFSSDSDEV